jgi:hydrogenase maturation protein HypF
MGEGMRTQNHGGVMGVIGNEADFAYPHDLGAGAGVARWQLRVYGRVQGVGFRPFVYRRATERALVGFVRNDASGVIMEVQGSLRSLRAFVDALYKEAPVLARVEHVDVRELKVKQDVRGFEIRPSEGGRINTSIPTDAATCNECLVELFDARNRRYRYPFINCSHCGPRFSIIAGMPYDRHKTTMAHFTLCGPCADEYGCPENRRFHAEPVACAACGPRLALWDANGQEQAAKDVIAVAFGLMRDGATIAVKGIGGYHLMCDARNAQSVAALRRRKGRLAKPFALLALNVASCKRFAHISASERELLEGADRPIVLLRKAQDCDKWLAGVAPDLNRIGVMLAYTPIHYLLFHEAAGRATGTKWLGRPHDMLFVCTSANPGGEPLVTGNEEALSRLNGLADFFLVHDRAIVSRCDDGVVRADAKGRAWLRLGRGQAPSAIRLSLSGPPVLALGAMLKDTVCVTRDNEAFVSPHIGDLENRRAYRALDDAAASLMALTGVEPQCVAHDLHPDYPSTRFAERLAAQRGIVQIPVQHHQAHVAAVLAEHKVSGPVLGVALDGVGYGLSGEIWGGELLWLKGAQFTRLGSLSPLPLPGADSAAREPWRMAASVLHALGRADEIPRRFPGAAAGIVTSMLERRLNTPSSSSAGRLFDAAAALLHVCTHASYEGQAAMMLEALAAQSPHIKAYTNGYVLKNNHLDLLPVLDFLRTCVDPPAGAAIFHATLIKGLEEWIMQAVEATGVARVALAGGCFANGILREGLRTRLERRGVAIYRAARMPPNDGGISLGQAWVALHALREGM